jgi:copper(I)-binding protein
MLACKAGAAYESKDVGGVVKMQARHSVEIPPKGEIELKPMAIHLMLIGLKKTLNELDTFPITLKFKNSGNVEADVEVTAPRTVHAPHSSRPGLRLNELLHRGVSQHAFCYL